jgi:hypothetical protein
MPNTFLLKMSSLKCLSLQTKSENKKQRFKIKYIFWLEFDEEQNRWTQKHNSKSKPDYVKIMTQTYVISTFKQDFGARSSQ